jgi:hypothetical protein
MMQHPIEGDLLAHLDRQIISAQRLLGFVLAQGVAIREREVDTVLARLNDIQIEMGKRGRLEKERADLLASAGAMLGTPAGSLTMEHLCAVLSPSGAQAATYQSGVLRALLGEIAREHGINRALMRQELAFLSHLTRLLGSEPDIGYQPQTTPGQAPSERTLASTPNLNRRLLDLQA